MSISEQDLESAMYLQGRRLHSKRHGTPGACCPSPEPVARGALVAHVATEGSTLYEVFPLVAGLAGDEGGGQGGRAEVKVPLKQHGLTLSSLKGEQKVIFIIFPLTLVKKVMTNCIFGLVGSIVKF